MTENDEREPQPPQWGDPPQWGEPVQWAPPAEQHHDGPRWSEPDANGRRYMVAPPPPAREPALWLPWYGAPFLGSFRRYWKKYATFSGRASRSEVWWALLGYYILTLVVEIPYMVGTFQWEFSNFDNLNSSTSTALEARDPLRLYRSLFEHLNPTLVVGFALLFLWGLANVLPVLALAMRRLHDTNRRGWWVLLGFVPLVGGIVLIVFFCLESDPRGQRFDRTHPDSATAHG